MKSISDDDCLIGVKKGDYVCVVGGWTTETPTEGGLYWARHSIHGVVAAEIRDPHGYKLAWLIGEDLPLQVEEFTRWLGPIPVPEPPEE